MDHTSVFPSEVDPSSHAPVLVSPWAPTRCVLSSTSVPSRPLPAHYPHSHRHSHLPKSSHRKETMHHQIHFPRSSWKRNRRPPPLPRPPPSPFFLICAAPGPLPCTCSLPNCHTAPSNGQTSAPSASDLSAGFTPVESPSSKTFSPGLREVSFF